MFSKVILVKKIVKKIFKKWYFFLEKLVLNVSECECVKFINND